jgi:hypothetical protein
MSTDSADLRTLATVAAHDVDCPDGPNCGDELTTDGRYGRYAAAVLAAVLPEHRRMVLAEAADLAESMVKTWPGMGDQAKAGNEHLRQAARRIRALAAAAPPAGLSAPVPAGNAPAVPEEADGQQATEGPYRVGRKVGRTIYRMAGNEPSDADELVGVMDSPALAAFAVRGMNAETRGGRVPLADVLDALRDDDAYHRWRKALTGVRPEYPPPTTRHHLADYLAERCASADAPEGADERNGHG